MRRSVLFLSLLVATLLSVGATRAADLVPDLAPYPTAPIVAVAPPPIEPATPAACWRYGNLGWGWYPCYAGPPPYWHYYRGYHHGYRGRPYWARWHRWHRWFW
ncbi:MAG TPA: hypothetical protein VKX28_28335 [Xanthobacteraceae bacterium]|nr:hypothetical protein [Xanthobacteraceae bacterium]